MLELFHNKIWIVRHPFEFLGINLAPIMTIIRLNDGSLCIHSPLPTSRKLISIIKELGQVSFIIMPNKLQYPHTTEFIQHFPKSVLLYPSGLKNKQLEKLANKKKLEMTEKMPILPFEQEIDRIMIPGIPLINENVFFHKCSNTLIVSHLIFNLKLTKFKYKHYIGESLGIRFGEPFQPWIIKILIRHKQQYNIAIEKIKEWDIKRVITRHGSITKHSMHKIYPQIKQEI